MRLFLGALSLALTLVCSPTWAVSEKAKQCAARASGLILGDSATFKPATQKDRNRLKIRPDLTNVRVAKQANSHLQAVGYDSAGRQQYIYHPLWNEVRDKVKFARMVDFGRALSNIRLVVRNDLRHTTLDRENVLAAVVRLLDRTLIRVGSLEYADENESYGLTTMLEEHVRVRGTRVTFSFTGKSGVEHVKMIDDAKVAEVIRGLRNVGDEEVFEHFDEDGEIRDVTANDVNKYLREAADGDFSAKDFRTWGGTVAAVEFLSNAEPPDSEEELKSLFAATAEFVSERLGNTPAVARNSYIDPRVFENFKKYDGFDFALKHARRSRQPQLSVYELATLIVLGF